MKIKKSKVVDEFYQLDVKLNETLIKQGDAGINFYIVESGNFDIFVQDEQNKQNKVAKGPGTNFGELALMYNAPRAATVISTKNLLYGC